MAPKKKLQTNTKAAIKLPAEIWLDILSRCSYFDLKRAQRVTKAFNKLIATPYFDARLFRAPPSSPLTPTARPVVHPILSGLDLVADQLRDFVLYTGKGVNLKTYDICKLKLARTEMVTSPSSSELQLENLGEGEGGIYVKNENGVTILDFLEAVVSFWNEPSDEYDQDELDDVYEHHYEPELQELTMYEALMKGDEGAKYVVGDEAMVSEQGVVELTAVYP
ncbi:hypothetical protein BCR35DRAFT_330211 [Leucosporidium creatinivorum]|uniref:F-box domain-containing protein n=1 Tax=Leucosporidium creatinivorum TaxID=106004 RepID=A0A1Y2FWI4_9BASI|nr:hypothetical protein BCR35DRAFT_330211 [Leucosporidium creatinivorum]